MEQDGLHAAVDDLLDVFILEDHVTVDDNLVTLDGNAFARIFVDEVFKIRMQHTGGKFTA